VIKLINKYSFVFGLIFLVLGLYFYQEFKSFLAAVIFFLLAIGFFYRA
jgi:hypothetical protein|tara:strand:+ start:194 stop:337 length:144 start_codon:yes stop_codon:yes gene_type:complete